VRINTPVEGEVLDGVIAVRGSADAAAFATYELHYGISHDPGAFSAPFAGNNIPIIDTELGQWDTTGLENGPYTLRLVVRDTFGNAHENRVRVYIEHGAPTDVPTLTPTWTPEVTETPTLAPPTDTPAPIPPTDTPVVVVEPPTNTPEPPPAPPVDTPVETPTDTPLPLVETPTLDATQVITSATLITEVVTITATVTITAGN
jgi:hypothetical protein